MAGMSFEEKQVEMTRRKIGSLACQEEVMGYEAQAKKRGIRPLEIELLADVKERLKRQKKWNLDWERRFKDEA